MQKVTMTIVNHRHLIFRLIRKPSVTTDQVASGSVWYQRPRWHWRRRASVKGLRHHFPVWDHGPGGPGRAHAQVAATMHWPWSLAGTAPSGRMINPGWGSC
jgi:hypothetical protein